jgi:hypothetical protein
VSKYRLLQISTRRTRYALASLVAACAIGIGALTIGLPIAAATTETTVSVPATQEFTDAGIALTVGEKVKIEASGTIEYVPGKQSSPIGDKFFKNGCGAVAYNINPPPFVEPGLNCWSMVFRIGTSGVAFPTGGKITFVSPVAGELYLGVNDNFYPDNSGSWTAKITTS